MFGGEGVWRFATPHIGTAGTYLVEEAGDDGVGEAAVVD